MRGFTLIELLITMVIIALITTIALPNFSKIQTRAKENNVKSTVHSIQVAVEAYGAAHGTYPAGSDLDLPALVTILSASGELSRVPVNPFTGALYSSNDASGKILYSYDASTDVYTISGYGLGNTAPILRVQNL